MHNVPLIPPQAPPPRPARGSALLPIGIAFLVGGVVLPRPLHQLAEGMSPSLLRAVLFFSTDVFRLGFFVGIALVIIGARRNRKTPPPS